MSENNFRSHFWPFQIDRSFWMSEIHFGWNFWPFQIHTFFIFDKMAVGGHLGCPKITFDRISGHFGDGCVADENIIFQETCVSREYNNVIVYGRWRIFAALASSLEASNWPTTNVICTTMQR